MAIEDADRLVEEAREQARRNPPALVWRDRDGAAIPPLDYLRLSRADRGAGLGGLDRVLRTTADEFILVMADEVHVVIGDHDALLTPKVVQGAIFRQTGVAPQIPATRPPWVPAANALRAIARDITEEEEGRIQEPENEETRAAMAIVQGGARALPTVDRLAEFLKARLAFTWEERLHLHGPTARAELARGGYVWTNKEMGRRLGLLGFDSRRLSAREGEKVEKSWLWVSPAGFASP